MRYFFVDTENISDYNFVKEMNVSSNDTIVLFMSENAGRIKLEDLKAINTSKASIIYEDVYIGEANALDFQLIALLSLNIGNSESASEYIVVSNDNGYELPVKYLGEKTDKKVSILKTNGVILNEQKKISIKKVLFEGLDKICKKSNLEDNVFNIIRESKDLRTLHNKLIGKFGNENGKKIYMKIRPHVKSLYKS